jgi:hypothetical protein
MDAENVPGITLVATAQLTPCANVQSVCKNNVTNKKYFIYKILTILRIQSQIKKQLWKDYKSLTKMKVEDKKKQPKLFFFYVFF